MGVFYYTFDGFSGDNFPIFSAHLALSSDQGVTFSDQVLLTFLSSAMDNGNSQAAGAWGLHADESGEQLLLRVLHWKRRAIRSAFRQP